ncbi:multicopper oxidase domain-containing protein [Lentibacillus sp. CBA3610]|uniref:multicopper oxidase domain-containing protein n=1 Tax=Lentibacillus sp. CBA3610 TaxID=2518176 RepID=UPI001594EA7F|nr:multicopper oxidase domain-containing protein [Lentibacillus sp. CBA3610]QKY69923.1 nitrite reductase [Lentibacillus sp. CBA3610]
MFKWLGIQAVVGLSVLVLLLSACSGENAESETDVSPDLEYSVERASAEEAPEVIPAHEGINHEPTPLDIERDGDDVYINMTAQITDIEIEDDYNYKAWTFNGEAPGPVVVVNEGDTIHFTLDNMDPSIPHSMDFHAVHTAPDKGYADVGPNEDGTFVYQASSPGVFMYHCGTDPVLSHIANGMHGVIIVQPDDGYPTDDEVDQEYVIIQNEWYKYNDLDNMTNEEPSQVVFSTKALHEDQPNTNGTVGALIDEPLEAKVGDKVRFYINNVGPNEISSFHVIGTMFDDVYIDGNPANHQEGMQTVGLPASGGAVVEFTVKEAGTYPFVTHQFEHVHKGAIGELIVTE